MVMGVDSALARADLHRTAHFGLASEGRIGALLWLGQVRCSHSIYRPEPVLIAGKRHDRRFAILGNR